MNKRLLFVLFLICSLMSINGQVIADFENFNIPLDTFNNGQMASGGFESGGVILSNSYDQTWDAWSGFSISTMRDTLSAGFTNQYSSIVGGGVNGSDAYATSFVLGQSIIKTNGVSKGGVVNGCYLTNATYTFLSMRDGDMFAKKFGGISGDDPDFFKVIIKKYKNGILGPDSIEFFLADYRFDNSDEDYLIDEWTFVDLSSLGEVDSLSFTLKSSDNGSFGMNTPAYFCIDNIETEDIKTSLVPDFGEQVDWGSTLYSQPFEISNVPADSDLSVYTLGGGVIGKTSGVSGEYLVDLEEVPSGLYFIRIENNGKNVTHKVVKP